MCNDQAIAAEKDLAATIEAGDERAVLAWLEGPLAAQLEFTGRCYSLAITGGMAEAAVLMGRSGFHLAVTDDEAAKRSIEAASSMRGLLDFMGTYRYCKAQRSYYLPVVSSTESTAPIGALLAQGLLSEHDKSELLSLSIRMDNAALARVLVAGGAQLIDDIRQDIPQELREANDVSMDNTGKHWAEMVTPQRSLKMLELIFEQTGNAKVHIHKGWWGSYSRQEGFAARMGAIAKHSSGELCEDTPALLTLLAAAGDASALSEVVVWEGMQTSWLDAALDAARDAKQVEAANVIMRARNAAAGSLDLLDF